MKNQSVFIITVDDGLFFGGYGKTDLLLSFSPIGAMLYDEYGEANYNSKELIQRGHKTTILEGTVSFGTFSKCE
jgi:hypothetical protein